MRLCMLDALLIEVGRDSFILLSEIIIDRDDFAYSGSEQRINLFQTHIVCWHTSLLFNLTKPGSNARKTRLLHVDHLLDLRLFELEHPLQLLQGEVFLQEFGNLEHTAFSHFSFLR